MLEFRKWARKHETALESVGLALPLCLLIGLLLLAAPPRTDATGAVHFASIGLLIINLLASTTGAILNIIALSDRGSEQKRIRHGFFVCLQAALLSGLDLINIFTPVQTLAFLTAMTLLSAGFIYSVLSLLSDYAQWKDRERLVIPPIILIILSGLVVPLSNNLLNINTALNLIGVLRELSISLVPAAIWLTRHHKEANNRPVMALNLQWQFWTFVALATANLLSYGAISFFSGENTPNTQVLGSFVHSMTWAWIPAFSYAIHTLRERKRNLWENQAVASLPTQQARRFLLRYASDAERFAATMGMRTVSFLVDHDPYDDSTSHLTATLSHIRREEIERSIVPLLADKLLYRKSIGNQILGTIDPEHSVRPCIDTLTLFSCIYLDAVPLIERRLKNLAALFPIIDPNIARNITPRDIEATHARMEWLFYFDYDWVDQQVVGSLSKADYGVNVNSLKAATRHRILAYLQEKNRMGNFIWLSERARERTMMEAPYLGSIIEACEITEDNMERSRVFFMRFEEVIPRIQKYFNLEESRRVLRDFDVGQESQKFLNMLESHIAQADGLQKLAEIVQTIQDYEWHGFKERDTALRLVLRSYERVQEFMNMDSNTPANIRESVRRRFFDAVDAIGYPGQLLYTAHMDKRSIRSADRLARICVDARHRRFVEAWLFLATMDGHFYSADELIQFMQIIMRAMDARQLKNHPVVRQKAVEAFFNLTLALRGKTNKTTIEPLLTRMVSYLIEQKATPEMCCFFIDGKIHLEEKWGESLRIEHSVLSAFEDYGNSLAKKYGSKSSPIIALASRWRLLLEQTRHDRVA